MQNPSHKSLQFEQLLSLIKNIACLLKLLLNRILWNRRYIYYRTVNNNFVNIDVCSEALNNICSFIVTSNFDYGLIELESTEEAKYQNLALNLVGF